PGKLKRSKEHSVSRPGSRRCRGRKGRSPQLGEAKQLGGGARSQLREKREKAAERGLERRAEGAQTVLAAGCEQAGWRSALGRSAGHPRAQGEVSNEQTAPLGALPTG
ncbi:hypothetical protein EI555_017825, partial [Monodon monoceros]